MERISGHHPMMMLGVALVTIIMLLVALWAVTTLRFSCELSRVTSAFIIATAVGCFLAALGGTVGLRGTVFGIPMRAAGGAGAFVLCIIIVLATVPGTCNADQAAFVIRNFRQVSGWTQPQEPPTFARISHNNSSKLITTDEREYAGNYDGTILFVLSGKTNIHHSIEIFRIVNNSIFKFKCDINIKVQSDPPKIKNDIYKVDTGEINADEKIFAFDFVHDPAISNHRSASGQGPAALGPPIAIDSCLQVAEAQPLQPPNTQANIANTGSATSARSIPVWVNSDIWVVPLGPVEQFRSMASSWKRSQIAVYVRGSPAAVPRGGATPGESVSPSEKSMQISDTEVVRSSLPMTPEPATTIPTKRTTGHATRACDQMAANAAVDRIIDQLTIEKDQLKTVVEQWSCARNRIADRLADLAAEPTLSTEAVDTQRQLLDLVRAVTSEVDLCWSISIANRAQRAGRCAAPAQPARPGRMRDLSIALPWSDKLRKAVIASLSANDATVRTSAQLVVANYPAREIQQSIEDQLRTSRDTLQKAQLADAYARMLYNAIYEYFFADDLTNADVADIRTRLQQISATRGALSAPEQTAAEAYVHYIRAVVLQKWRQTRADADKDLIAESYGKLLALTVDSARHYRFPHHIAVALAFDRNELEKFNQLDGAQFNALSGGSALTLASDGRLSLYPVPPSNPAEPKADTTPLGPPTQNDRSPTVAFMKYGDWSLVYRNNRWGWLNTPQTTASNH
ncbi:MULTISPECIES: QueT transporter family protein [unclassified Xanthobacter]|uniref:QueT transporter family protein n=1 Tax=unclassified Xanthobacter TaxID=2623496 RepID=UPI001EE0D66B|nr:MULTISPECIES: QueT transporter family protein [unclassified Xanthobacter]